MKYHELVRGFENGNLNAANEDSVKVPQDDDDLPEWVQSKIAKASDNLSSVQDYLSYKIYRDIE